MNSRVRATVSRYCPAWIRDRLRTVEAMMRHPVAPDDLKRARQALLMSHSQMSGFDLLVVPRQPHRSPDTLTAAFYDRQHHDVQYRQNNWLLDELHVVKSACATTIVEIGCGNGLFLRAAAPYAQKIIGIDWARSPELSDLPTNVEVHTLDVVTDGIPAGDLICSADVLEHFAPADVDLVVSKLVRAGAHQHHVIACYDDGHTHLSILPPAGWLALFRKYCQTAYLADIRYRRNDPAQIVCVVSNLPLVPCGPGSVEGSLANR